MFPLPFFSSFYFPGNLPKFSIVVRHDNSGIGPGWFLDKVIIETGAGERYFFHCGRWLADNEDDKQISREIAAVKDDSENYLPLTIYRITVVTGDRWGAGTDSRVFITLSGKNGKSKETRLDNSQDNFERNKTDVFGIESAYLGEIEEAHIRIDGSGFGSDWFLEKVSVHSEKDNKDWFFMCGSWLSKEAGLSKTIKAVSEDGTCSLPLVQYKISVITGDRRGAGTDANVWIEITGDQGESNRRPLDAPAVNLFERGQTDDFGIEAVDLGELKKIRIGHDNSGFSAGRILRTFFLPDFF
jgi:hypothetical protein